MSRSGVRVLRMRGLPFCATDSEVKAFFREYSVEDVRIGMRQGKPTGEAFVRFSDERNCTDALAHRDKQMLGKRYIELFKAKDQDLDSNIPEVSISGKSNVIRMRGLPFSACIGDILEFFKQIPALDTENVYFVYDSSGRPSGEAYISFSSTEACSTAMKLHKNKMGSRYIELFPSSSVDVQRAAKQRKLRLAKVEGATPRAPAAPKATNDAKTPKSPVQCPVEATPKQATQPQHLSADKAPAAAPLRRTFASITAAPPASKPEEVLSANLGALELQSSPCENSSVPAESAEAQPGAVATAAAPEAEHATGFSVGNHPAESPGFVLPQTAHVAPPHVESGIPGIPEVPGPTLMGAPNGSLEQSGLRPNGVGASGIGASAMGASRVGASGMSSNGLAPNGMGPGGMSASSMGGQRGSFAVEQLSGYAGHGMLSAGAPAYTQQQMDYGALPAQGMLAGGMHMRFPPAATLPYSAGVQGPPHGLGHAPNHPVAASNRQNVPPNVPPPMHHDEMWSTWGQRAVPGGIRELWQTDVDTRDPKKVAGDSLGAVHHQRAQYARFGMSPYVQQDFNSRMYYPMGGQQNPGAFRDY